MNHLQTILTYYPNSDTSYYLQIVQTKRILSHMHPTIQNKLCDWYSKLKSTLWQTPLTSPFLLKMSCIACLIRKSHWHYSLSQQVYSTSYRTSWTTERQLIIDLKATWEAYNKMEKGDIEWILRLGVTTSFFTKIATNAALHIQLETRILLQEVRQWIVCDEQTSSAAPIAPAGKISHPKR